MTVTIALKEQEITYGKQQNRSLKHKKASQRNDLLFKGILQDLFEDFLTFMVPDAQKRFDMGRGFEFLNKELEQLFPPDEDMYQTRIIDHLVKVYMSDGKEEWILCHLEVQDQYSSDFNERMFRYFIRIYDRYQKPISAYAILTEANKIYRSNIFSVSCLGTRLDYSFNIFKIADQSETELEISQNPFAKVVLITKAALESKKKSQGYERDNFLLEIKTKLAKHLLSQNMDKQKVRMLINFLKYHIRFNDNHNNIIFEQRLNQITERNDTMGIEEQIIDLAKKEGKQEEKIQTALEMKKNNFSDEVIASITKLSLEEIREL